MPDHAQDATVFFVHVMKTGGSTVLRHMLKHYPQGSVYPEPGALAAIEKKGFVSRFTELTAQEQAALRWITPHLPLSVATQFRSESQRPVRITLVLRDGLERALSHLRQVSRRFEHRYSYRELLDVPLLGEFFLSNHQTRVLGSTPADWPQWDACIGALMALPACIDDTSLAPQIKPVDEDTLQRALAGLDEVDVLGLQDEFDSWWQRCEEAFGWPAAPTTSVNVGADQDKVPPPPIPEAIIAELRERNALDTRLYAAARQRLAG